MKVKGSWVTVDYEVGDVVTFAKRRWVVVDVKPDEVKMDHIIVTLKLREREE